MGDVNTYSIFAETARNLIKEDGRVGIIVPTGIATDDTCKMFLVIWLNNSIWRVFMTLKIEKQYL
ncbi:Putative type II DNA modification enzyme [Raphidiopsis brookii D9]|nr:Putative type II DNA modification enzyme [Raphidiopsis brookii D9]